MRSDVNAAVSAPKSLGFSLVEGVVVVSLVGIVSAFAVPRFTHLANDARAAEVHALSTYLQTTADNAHDQYLASGKRLSVAILEGRSVNLKNGYPDAGAGGIRNGTFDDDGFKVEEGDEYVAFSRHDAPPGDRCSVTYRTAQAGGAATVTNIDTSGC